VIAVAEESLDVFTGRTSVAAAELFGHQATVFPSHHGGFLSGDSGYLSATTRARASGFAQTAGREAFSRSSPRS
jgi:hypothetical protein